MSKAIQKEDRNQKRYRMFENQIGIPIRRIEDFDQLHPGVRNTVKRDKYGNVVQPVILH